MSLLLAFALAGCATQVPTPAPPRSDPSAAWQTLLARIVTTDGLVRYDLLREDPTALRDFVGWIAVHGPETDSYRLLDDNRRLAWHLNAYNALALWGVLQAGPIASVKDVPGFFWRQAFAIDGERMSLHTYESRVLLPTYEEPLVHAALVCASRSCPPLSPQLYRSADLQVQLEGRMRTWVGATDPTRAAVTWDGDELVFNPIFDWYHRDFRDWAGAENPCEAVRPYANSFLRAHLDAPGCPHRFYDYDWGLNEG